MDSTFWHGKRVLVTGGNGFVATHIVKALLRQGAYVVVTVRQARAEDVREMIVGKDHIGQSPMVEQIDSLDYDASARVCDEHLIDTVFHLAATSIVGEARNAPKHAIENNVLGTLNLLEVARTRNIPRVLIASSYKAYGNFTGESKEGVPYKEQYALRGLDTYSASKVCTDVLSQSYASQYGLSLAVLRSCHVYGPGDMNFSRLFPRTLMRLMNGLAPQIVQESKDILLEYMYIDDVVRGFLMVAESLSAPSHAQGKAYGDVVYNLGSCAQLALEQVQSCNAIHSLENVIDTLRSHFPDAPAVEKLVTDSPSVVPDQYLDSSKLLSLGFHPEVQFEDGVARTIAWYEQHREQLAPLASTHL